MRRPLFQFAVPVTASRGAGVCLAVIAVLAGCVIIPYKPTTRVTYSPSSADTTWGYMKSEPHELIEKMSDAIHKVDSDITVVDPKTFLDAAFFGEDARFFGGESRQLLSTEVLLDSANCARLREKLRIDFVLLIGAPTVSELTKGHGEQVEYGFIGAKKVERHFSMTGTVIDLKAAQPLWDVTAESDSVAGAVGFVFAVGIVPILQESGGKKALARGSAERMRENGRAGPLRVVVMGHP